MNDTLGLVSISFRKHEPAAIVQAVKDAGLTAIEWGGDVHMPHGDVARAAEVRALCDAAGLTLPEYGSYYRAGATDPAVFDGVLAVAETLGTPVIRFWAGDKPTDGLSGAEYGRIVEDVVRICDLAAAKGIVLCPEWHQGTLTDEYHTALRFFRDVGRPNLQTFWQPNQFRPLAYNLDALAAVLPFVRTVHVFSWQREKWLPLAAGAEDWKQYLALLKTAPRCYMLEFMHDNRLESLPETAATLREWLAES